MTGNQPVSLGQRTSGPGDMCSEMWIWGKGSPTSSNNVWPCYLGSAWYNAWHTVIIQSKSDWQEVCWLLGDCLSKVDKPGNITESVVSQFWRSQVQIRVMENASFLSLSAAGGPRRSLVYGSVTSSLCLCLCVALLPLSFLVFSPQVSISFLTRTPVI